MSFLTREMADKKPIAPTLVAEAIGWTKTLTEELLAGDDITQEAAQRLRIVIAAAEQAVAITLVTAQLGCEQKMLADCRSLLDGFDIPTNGAEGIGKRQELTVSQRVKLLGDKLATAIESGKESGK